MMKCQIAPFMTVFTLVFLVGAGLWAKPLDRSCPDGGTWSRGGCYYTYNYDYTYDYEYHELAPEKPADSK